MGRMKKFLCLALCLCLMAGMVPSGTVQAANLEVGGGMLEETAEIGLTESDGAQQDEGMEEPDEGQPEEELEEPAEEQTEKEPEKPVEDQPVEGNPEEEMKAPAEEQLEEETAEQAEEESEEQLEEEAEEPAEEQQEEETAEPVEEQQEEETAEILEEEPAAAIQGITVEYRQAEGGLRTFEPILLGDETLEQMTEEQERANGYVEEISFSRRYSYSSDYCYGRLNSVEKQVYNDIEQNLQYYMNSNVSLSVSGDIALDTSRALSRRGLSVSEVTDIMIICLYQNPEYYFALQGIAYDNYGRFYVVCYPEFANGNTRANATQQFFNKVDGWIDYVNGARGAYNKEKRAYDLVCQNVSYVSGYYDQSAYSAVMYGQTVCAGYSKLFSMLCNAVGIDTVGIASDRSVHAWNSVYLYGDWYNVDATWGDQVYFIDYDYFNRSDDFFYYGHRLDSNWIGVAPEAPMDYLPFSDMPEKNGWRFDAVNLVYGSGIMQGISGTTRFDPDENLTREMFATTIYRVAGSPAASYDGRYPDVKAPNYYVEPIAWATSVGVVQGHSNTGLFGVHEDITREDLVVMMYRYARTAGLNTGGSVSLSKFPDASEVSGYASAAMSWAVGNGIVQGRSNTGMLDPKGNATRVEAAAILQRFIEKYMPEKIR